MTRWEARALLAFAISAITAAVTWLFGPYGLLGAGLVLAAIVLFVIDVRERVGGEALADAPWAERGSAVRR